MGRLRRKRVHNARRDIHRACRTRVRTKDLDQIQLVDLDPKVHTMNTMIGFAFTNPFILQNRAALEAQAIDFEKPGLAQHYCVECAKYNLFSDLLSVFSQGFSRYFETDVALQSHWKSKVHKRRCKQLKEPAYSIEEAERAAGLGKEGKRPPLLSQTDIPIGG